MDIKIRVLGGLPALARINSYHPYVPPTWNDPPEGPELEWELLDSRGRKAAWIEKRMSAKELENVEAKLFDTCAEAYRNRRYADL